jgi:tRNA pseudouridine55 synthase
MQNEPSNLEGFLLINKPKDISSFDCIRHIKKILKQKIKIGHTGTLDNFANGLLIICIGKAATKFSGTLTNLDKEYIVKAKLGELTDTLDHTGKIVEQIDTNNLKISHLDIKKAIEKLGKEYFQIPPIYSALKHEGISLYKLARNKKLDSAQLEKIVEQKSRKVILHEIDLIEFYAPFFTIKTTVSKGTYVRSLANDIAQILKIPATTYELERTKIGPFDIKESVELKNLQDIDDIKKHLCPVEKVKEKFIF